VVTDLAYASATEVAAAIRARQATGAIVGVKVDGTIAWTLTYPANSTGHPAASVLAAAGAMERIRPWSDTYAVPAGRSLA
jgi:hypothetical protein